MVLQWERCELELDKHIYPASSVKIPTLVNVKELIPGERLYRMSHSECPMPPPKGKRLPPERKAPPAKATRKT